jgi:peptidoglycan/LPS O-acetylase OafA/YrhL
MSRHISALDGVRGVAALGVLLFHIGIYSGRQFVPSAQVAVDLFFTLSGFVMARAYDDRVTGWRFVRVRIGRLWPMILIAAGLSAVAYHARPDALALAALAVLCIPTFTGGPLFPLNNAQWSLFFECVANLAHLAGGRLVSLAAAAIVLASGAVIAFAGPSFGGSDAESFWFGLARVGYGYFAGVLVQRHARPAPTVPAPLIYLACAVLFTLPLDVTHGQAAALGTPLLVWMAASAKDPAPRVSAWLGALSYPLYLAHMPVVAAVERHFGPNAVLMLLGSLVAGLVATVVDAAIRGLLKARDGRAATA